MSKSIHDLKVGQTLKIGNATIRLEKKSGQLARLVVQAPTDTIVQMNKPHIAHECIPDKEGFTHGKYTI